MNEFAQYSAIQTVVDQWAKMMPNEREALLRGFAPIFPETYGRFEQEQFDHLARQPHPNTLPLNVLGHLFISVTSNGFSAEQIMTVLEDAANSFQG